MSLRNTSLLSNIIL